MSERKYVDFTIERTQDYSNNNCLTFHCTFRFQPGASTDEQMRVINSFLRMAEESINQMERSNEPSHEVIRENLLKVGYPESKVNDILEALSRSSWKVAKPDDTGAL